MGTPDNLFLILVLFWVVQEDETRSPFFGGSGFFIYLYFGGGNVPDDFFLLFCPNLTPPFQRLVVAGGFGDVSALASTEVITVPLEFY